MERQAPGHRRENPAMPRLTPYVFWLRGLLGYLVLKAESKLASGESKASLRT